MAGFIPRRARDGFGPGRITWVSLDCYASWPTVEVARTDRLTEQAYTELVTRKVASDPQWRTHVAIPNVVMTADGQVGALDPNHVRTIEDGPDRDAWLEHAYQVALGLFDVALQAGLVTATTCILAICGFS